MATINDITLYTINVDGFWLNFTKSTQKFMEDSYIINKNSRFFSCFLFSYVKVRPIYAKYSNGRRKGQIISPNIIRLELFLNPNQINNYLWPPKFPRYLWGK